MSEPAEKCNIRGTNFVGQKVSQNTLLSHFCPTLFSVGQNSRKSLKAMKKTLVPLWDKTWDKTGLPKFVPSHPPVYGQGWWDNRWDETKGEADVCTVE